MIPDYMTDEQTDLVPVLTEIDQPSLPIWFVYPEELKSSKKVQLLRDFLVAKARQSEILTPPRDDRRGGTLQPGGRDAI